MADYPRPSMRALIARIGADIESRITGANAKLKWTVEGGLARVMAGATNGSYGFISYMARQMLPSTATEEWLDAHADVWLGADARKAASASIGTIRITGVDTTVIPIGTAFARPQDGVQFTTDAAATIGSVTTGLVDVAVTASVPAALGDTPATSIVTIVTPIVDVDSDATVLADSEGLGLSGGADIESDDDLSARVLQRIQASASGGGPGDYVTEALKLVGITHGWQKGGEDGPGTVAVYVVNVNADPITVSGAKITELQAAMDAFAPVTSTITAKNVTTKAINPNIIPIPDTAAVRASIQASLIDMLNRERDPGVTLPFSKVREAVSIAPGETDHTFSSSTADITHVTGEVPILGSIIWPL